MSADLAALARGWIGTPFVEGAAVRGVGCDCLGLVRGVLAEATGRPLIVPPPPGRDWALDRRLDPLLSGLARHADRVGKADARPGDVLVFRYHANVAGHHCGMLSAPGRMIHAAERSGVAEVGLDAWERRLAAVFRMRSARD